MIEIGSVSALVGTRAQPIGSAYATSPKTCDVVALVVALVAALVAAATLIGKPPVKEPTVDKSSDISILSMRHYFNYRVIRIAPD